MPQVWDLLEDACGQGGASTKAEQHSTKIRIAAALAHENKAHKKTIEPIENPNSKILALAAQAFQHDWETYLPQSVRDVVSYSDFPYATAEEQSRLPHFTSDKIPENYKKLFLKDTQLIINVSKLFADTRTAVKKWTTFLEFLGDANCSYIREIVFHFENVSLQLNIRSRFYPNDHDVFPNQIRAPITCFCFRLEPAPETPCFLKQNDAYFHQASDWLRQAFQRITEDRERLWGPGRFGMREINKLGKTVFRLPALCCYLQGQRRGVKAGKKGREDSGAHLELPVTALDAPGSPNCVVDLPEEVELRGHAEGCGECNCGWVRWADGAL